MIALGVSQSHDLSGTVFQRLIADRKFLATFYTRPESAALLAHLAIPDDGGWGRRGAGQGLPYSRLRLRDRHADTRGVQATEPAPLAGGWGAGETARAHDGERSDCVRCTAIIGAPDRVDALVVTSPPKLRRLSHHRHAVWEDRTGWCIHRLSRSAW